MSIKTYKKKVEAYIKQKESTASKGNDSKGLLSPKNPMARGTPDQKDAIATIGEFVYALRQKRQEFQQKNSKKESK
jgi:hypothetical protein